MKVLHIVCLAALFCVISCRQEEMVSGSGSLSVVLTDGEEALKVRSLPGLSAEMAGQFMLQIKNTDKDKTVFQNTLSAFESSAPHLFVAGQYEASALYGTNPDLALDAPYYTSAVIPFEIEAGKTCELLIPCSVSNSLASFKFGNQDKLEKVLKDYYIELTVGGQSVVWHPGDAENPYFRAGSTVELYLKGTWIENNNAYSNNFAVIKPAQKGKNYVYTLNIDTSNMTGVIFDLQVETSVETVTVNETIPQEWLPRPKLSATGFDEADMLTYVETSDAVTAQIAYTAVRPVEDVEFTLDFEDRQWASLNKTYQLSALTAEERTALESANITLPVLHATESVLDLSAMTASLLAKNEGDVNNRIRMKVKANGRWSEEKTYTVKTVKPEFAVSVYPGNIWTKEFTANTLMPADVKTGNVDKIIADVEYQFSTDGSSWNLLAEDMRKEGLTPGTTYYVRSLYRGELTSLVTEVRTYEQIALENGGLEGATITRGTDSPGFFGTQYGALYEWNGWGTTNRLTACSCPATAYSYNSRSGVRPTTDKPSSSSGSDAVRVITLSYGYGGTYNNPKNFTHSELYLGANADDNGNRTYGIAFESHPTGISFWYKCLSNVGNDVSQVKVQLYSDDTLLGENVFETGNKENYEQYYLPINYIQSDDILSLFPNRLVVIFKSGTKADLSKSDLKQFSSGNTDKLTDAMWRGNELFIDDVSLVYNK